MSTSSIEEKKEVMIKLKKEGKTIREISKELSVSETTVYNYTRGIKTKKQKKSEEKRANIRKLLVQGNSIKDIVEITKVSEDYVRKMRETTEYEALARKEKLVKVKKTNRQIEIDKINKEHEEKKRRDLIVYKEQLEYEKEKLAAKYPYAFK